ncbi:MAG: hypothetical protein K2N89_06670 [Lachnospiraceae bacterium]|nr:hypothetical protein [Lachnospiraceae bacterium]
MKQAKLIKRTEWEIQICPFCYQKLGMMEIMKQKVLKICICRQCKKVINERYIIW